MGKTPETITREPRDEFTRGDPFNRLADDCGDK